MSDDALRYPTAAFALVGVLVAVYGALNARSARRAAERAQEGVIEVDGKVYSLGRAVDGRLSALLSTTEKLARAEVHAEGERSQRDRNSEKQP